jgi:hypothetical protein
MPQRQNTARVDATRVQGDGAYVVLRKATWEQTRRLQGADPTQSADLLPEIMAASVVDWNWVDDAGQPLGLPAVAGIGGLSIDEMTFLVQALVGSNPDASKN